MQNYNSNFNEVEGLQIELLSNVLKYKHIERFKNLSSELFGSYSFVWDSYKRLYEREGELNQRSLVKELLDNPMLVQSLREGAISDARTEFLVDALKKHYARRKIIRITEQVQLNALNSDPNELIKQLVESVDTILKENTTLIINPTKDYDSFLERLIDQKDNPSKFQGMMTGAIDLDSITGGWQKQDLIVVGGRTSMGKSAFALSNVLSLARSGYKCAVFSLEMSKHQVYARLASSAYNVPLQAFKMGTISEDSIGKMKEREPFWNNVLIDDTRGIDCEYIAEQLSAIKREYGLDFVVVDYLQDVREKGENNDNQGSSLSRVCRKLRKIAQDFDVPIMAMSQINRETEKRVDKRPTNAELSGSTGIETSADVIALLYRDEYYNPETEEKNVLELNITKHRNGALGQVKFFYDKSTQRISNYAKPTNVFDSSSRTNGGTKKNNAKRFRGNYDD